MTVEEEFSKIYSNYLYKDIIAFVKELSPKEKNKVISEDNWRGFLGEGAVLDSLIEEVPDEWIDVLDNNKKNNKISPDLGMIYLSFRTQTKGLRI